MEYKITLYDTPESLPSLPNLKHEPASLNTVLPIKETPAMLTVVPPAGESLESRNTIPYAKEIPGPIRNFKMTIVRRFRQSRSYIGGEVNPEIRFGGKYLEEFKFPIGTRLLVTIKKGRITIKADTHQPWLPKKVAKEVREAAASDDLEHLT